MRFMYAKWVLIVGLLCAGGCASTNQTAGGTPATNAGRDTIAQPADPPPSLSGTSRAPSTPQRPEAKPVQRPLPPSSKPEERPEAADEQRGFQTRYARFLPADFSEVPDWQKDQMRDAWLAFLRGCKTLAAKQLWAGTCAQATQLPGSDEPAIRRFIEQQFSLYQVLDAQGANGGVITGYYEPLLRGNRVPDDKFRHPVYGVPADLLYLDANRIPRTYPKQKVYARVDGRKVVPLPGINAPAPGIYPIEAGAIGSDRRMRVRLDGNRIVRYYTRSEIEQTRLPAARVLVWVDDPIMLYTMQVQGAGKVQLPDGKLVRLSFAEQNGYPFRSKIKGVSARSNVGRLRGGGATAQQADEIDDDSVDAEEDMDLSALTTGKRGMEVVRDPPTREQVAQRQAHDPSYVFFREIPDTPDGPIGALGVPLTAGRSVAVDPRITPLGAPLFLSTKDPRSDRDLNRLVMAQDTGGAIRGALRADYFFGFGPNAGDLANRMKNAGHLWLLLPKSFRPSAAMLAGRTRGAAPVECVIADPEFCSDTDPGAAASLQQ
jgi:membrane-bound lytic murein transglycosylase A